MMCGTTVGFYWVAIPNASATRVDVPSVFSLDDHNSPYYWDGDGPSSLLLVLLPSPISVKGLFRTPISPAAQLHTHLIKWYFSLEMRPGRVKQEWEQNVGWSEIPPY